MTTPMEDAAVDAYIAGPCWPFDSSTPKGEVVLGTGIDNYQPMPDVLKLVYGEQGGFHIEARSRIRGLEPGDPVDILNPRNPRTRFRAFWEGTGTPKDGMPINPAQCGTRVHYIPAPDGDGYILVSYFEIRFDILLPTSEIFDFQYRVIVEVIDGSLGYARDEKVITAVAPEGWPQ